MFYTSEQRAEAIRADLYDYLVEHHDEFFTHEGRSLRMCDNHSISIKEGYSGYYDFATDESGNGIDFLTKYFGYTVTEAIHALCGYSDGIIVSGTQPQKKLKMTDAKDVAILKKTANKPRQTYAYLMRRGISPATITMLMSTGLLYQAEYHNNQVFINDEQDCAEVVETNSFKKYRRPIRTRPDCFWYFGKGSKVYITEGAIDAVSLYELRKRAGEDDAIYVSMAGVGNQQIIDRIVKEWWWREIVIAVDNDNAGEDCRQRNSNLKCIVPIYKDWNEDLTMGVNIFMEEKKED